MYGRPPAPPVDFSGGQIHRHPPIFLLPLMLFVPNQVNQMPNLKRRPRVRTNAGRVRPRDSINRPSPEAGSRISYRQRVEIQTLHKIGWGYTRIATYLSIHRSTVRRAVSQPETP